MHWHIVFDVVVHGQDPGQHPGAYTRALRDAWEAVKKAPPNKKVTIGLSNAMIEISIRPLPPPDRQVMPRTKKP